MKIKLFSLLLVSTFLVSINVQGKELRIQAWEITDSQNRIMVVANGDIIWGHQFGFYPPYNQCDQASLWITLSTFMKGTEKYNRVGVEFIFEVNDELVTVQMPLTTVFDYTVDMRVLAFTGHQVNQEFLEYI